MIELTDTEAGGGLREAIHRNLLAAAHRVVHQSVPDALALTEHGWLMIDAGRKSMPELNGASPVNAVNANTIQYVEEWFNNRRAAPIFRLRTGADDLLISHLLNCGYRTTRVEPTLLIDHPQVPLNKGELEVVEVATHEQLEQVATRAGFF